MVLAGEFSPINMASVNHAVDALKDSTGFSEIEFVVFGTPDFRYMELLFKWSIRHLMDSSKFSAQKPRRSGRGGASFFFQEDGVREIL